METSNLKAGVGQLIVNIKSSEDRIEKKAQVQPQ